MEKYFQRFARSLLSGKEEPVSYRFFVLSLREMSISPRDFALRCIPAIKKISTEQCWTNFIRKYRLGATSHRYVTFILAKLLLFFSKVTFGKVTFTFSYSFNKVTFIF